MINDIVSMKMGWNRRERRRKKETRFTIKTKITLHLSYRDSSLINLTLSPVSNLSKPFEMYSKNYLLLI